MTAAGWAIALGVWVVAACLAAPLIGRALKAADPGEDECALELDEAELAGRFWGMVSREWAI